MLVGTNSYGERESKVISAVVTRGRLTGRKNRTQTEAVFLTKNLCHRETIVSKNDGNSYEFLLYSIVYFSLD